MAGAIILLALRGTATQCCPESALPDYKANWMLLFSTVHLPGGSLLLKRGVFWLAASALALGALPAV